MNHFRTEPVTNGLYAVYIGGKKLPRPYTTEEIGKLYEEEWYKSQNKK